MKRIEKMLERIGRDIRNVWKYIAAFLIYDAVMQFVFHQFCPSVIVTGLPCPGCGMTRAIFYFATGQFERGWGMNPLGILWLALGVYFCVMRYWFGKRAAGALEIGGILAGCMALFYVYRMYRYFPGNAPICYTPGNLLERVFTGYEDGILTLIGNLQKLF